MEASGCPPKQPTLSKMNKTQLIAEAVRVGAVVHPTWMVPELQATIREHIENHTEASAQQKMRGLSSMTLPERCA